MARWRQFARAFALLLSLHLLCFLTAEASHAHPAAATAHCELCAVPHVLLHTAAGMALPFVPQRFASPELGEESRGARPLTLHWFSRPPPEGRDQVKMLG